MTPRVSRIRVAPGVVLHVRTWQPPGPPGPCGARRAAAGAEATSPPFLLVHGLASNCRTWDGVAARLVDLGHPVAAVDLRGHGQSDKPDDGYDFATMGDDLLAVIDDLGWERPVVAGQSMGGNLVVALSARATTRFAGVVGVDGGAFDLRRRWPRWDECAEALAPPHLEGTPADVMEQHLRAAHPDWSNDGVAASMANFETRPDGTIRPWLTRERHMRVLRALWEHRPVRDFARIAVPATLVLADTGDEWAANKGAEAARAVAALPRLDVRWFSPADHDVHVQHPDELAELFDQRF